MLSIKYIIRKRAIGDVLWMEPVIAAMAKKYKKVIVHSLYNELFENYPYANVIFKSRLSFFEKVFCRIEKLLNTSFFFIDLQGAYENHPQEHLLSAYYKKAGQNMPMVYPSLYLSEKEKSKHLIQSQKYVVLHIENYGDEHKFRNIYAVNWEAVVAHLNNAGYHVVQIGKKANEVKGSEFVETNLRELMSVINACSFFIGSDSAPSHFSACLQKPAIIFFGSVNPWFRHIKELFKGAIMQSNCEYANCYHIQQPYKQVCLLKTAEERMMPKCCVHSTEDVNKQIELIIQKYSV
jgi:ADP-heptose:LPS heptosyltransferase